MPKVTLTRGRTYSVLGKIFRIGEPLDLPEKDAVKLKDNPSFRIETPHKAGEADSEIVELSRDELKAALDAAGVNYNARARTASLLELYTESVK